MPLDRSSKTEAHYRTGEPDGENCECCRHFHRTKTDCALVDGKINDDAVCDLWTRKRGT